MINRLGATYLGLWLIKRFISPAQRFLYRASGGQVGTRTGHGQHVLLLTTRGRSSGQERTIPVYFLRDHDRIVLCNVNPGSERTNPWVLNLRAHPIARLQIGPEAAEYQAHEATDAEVEVYWPQLLKIWPAYGAFFKKSHQRAICVLERV